MCFFFREITTRQKVSGQPRHAIFITLGEVSTVLFYIHPEFLKLGNGWEIKKKTKNTMDTVTGLNLPKKENYPYPTLEVKNLTWSTNQLYI